MASKTPASVLFVVFFFFFASGAAAEPRVGGRVMAEGRALAEAEVTLWPVLGRYEQARRLLAGTPIEPVARMLTGADGWFELLAPAPGAWRAQIMSVGRAPVEIELSPLLDSVDLLPTKLEKSIGFLSDLRAPTSTGSGPSSAPSLPSRPDPPASAVRRVRVVDPKGRPLAGVILFRAEEMSPLAQTDPAGEAILPRLERSVMLDLLTAEGAFARRPLDPASAEEATPAVLELIPTPQARGKILDHATGQPIAGAWVSTEKSADLAQTDVAGNYVLGGLGKPPTSLAVKAQGYVEIRDADTNASWELPTLKLLPAGSIAGRVVDEEGRPVADAAITVTLDPERGEEDLTGLGDARQVKTRTSIRGEFRAAGLAAGENYWLDWSKPGFVPGEKRLGPLKPGEKRHGLELVLAKGYKAVGRVTGPDDRPIVGAYVYLIPVPGNPQRRPRECSSYYDMDEQGGEAFTDAQGRFEITGLSPRRWELGSDAEGFVPSSVPGIYIAEGKRTVHLGTVILTPGLVIEGRVLDPAGQPIEGAEISVLKPGELPFLASVEERTDGEGHFRLDQLVQGSRMDLIVAHKGFLRTTLPGLEPPATGVEVVLQPASLIRGRVLDNARRPVVGAFVSVDCIKNDDPSVSWGCGTSDSDAEGKFETPRDVAPGKVEVIVLAEGFQSLALEGLEVPAGKGVEDLELVLSEGAVVEGRVLDITGEVLADALIKVLDPSKNDEAEHLMPMEMSDAEGRYSITDAVPGLRTVEVWLEGYDQVVRGVEISPGVNRMDFVLSKGADRSRVRGGKRRRG